MGVLLHLQNLFPQNYTFLFSAHVYVSMYVASRLKINQFVKKYKVKIFDLHVQLYVHECIMKECVEIKLPYRWYISRGKNFSF